MDNGQLFTIEFSKVVSLSAVLQIHSNEISPVSLLLPHSKQELSLSPLSMLNDDE